jgi:predicted DsbA family dithiol-disulfide isomerase
MAAAAVPDGLELHYERAIATGTFGAHCLVARAARQGLGEQAVERLFRAHFTDGLNIGDEETLAVLARELGVTADDAGIDQQVREGLRLVREAGVTSVPVIRFTDGPTFVGEQPEEVYWNAVRAAAAGSAPEPDPDGVANSKVPSTARRPPAMPP